jgi:hypothetical protein
LFVLITPSFKLGAAIIVAEFVVHYHIDWLKEQVMKRTGWQTADNGYWWALGGDQLLHQLSYVAIAGVLVCSVG